MAGQPWTNADGLVVRYGQEKVRNAGGGEFLSYGDWREISLDIPLAAVGSYTYTLGQTAYGTLNQPLYNVATTTNNAIVGAAKILAGISAGIAYQGMDQMLSGNVPVGASASNATTIVDLDTFFPLNLPDNFINTGSTTPTVPGVFSSNGIFLESVEIVSLTGLQGYAGGATGFSIGLLGLNPNYTAGNPGTNPLYQYITSKGYTGNTHIATVPNQFFAVPGSKVLFNLGAMTPDNSSSYVAALTAWTATSTIIAVASTNTWITAGMAIYDTTGSTSTTGNLIGYVSSITGTAVTMTNTAAFASSGATDTVLFGNGSWMGVLPTVTNQFTAGNQTYFPNKAWLCVNTIGGHYGAGSSTNWGGTSSSSVNGGIATGYTSQGLVRARIKYFQWGLGSDPTVYTPANTYGSIQA